MIALNEILKNKAHYERKYTQMGISHNLNKVIKLEQKFILLENNKNENRAKCNKLCSEIANKINTKLNPEQDIQQINILDKQIAKDEKNAQKAMTRINKILKKLPNLPLNDNILEINLDCNPNSSFTKTEFINKIENNSNSISINSIKKLLKEHKKVVLKAENLPTTYHIESKQIFQYIIIDNEESLIHFNQLVNYLLKNAIKLTNASIMDLKPDSSNEYRATLCDGSKISIEFLGEYISREIALKYYDKNLDMTKFINMIRITIHK